mgnify:CR=1 FL=1
MTRITPHKLVAYVTRKHYGHGQDGNQDIKHAGMMCQHTRSQVLVALVTASGLFASSKMGKTYRQVGGKERRLAKNMRKLNATWDVIQKDRETNKWW